MSDLGSVLSARPIKVKRSGVWPGIWSYLGGLLLLAGGIFIGVWQAPGIVRDWRISQDPVVVHDADITDGECSVSRGVFVDCSAHVHYVVKSKPFDHDIELMFVDLGSGDYEVDVVRSGEQPQLATLSLGLDMLWNRIIVGALFVLFLVGAGVALFLNGLRADRLRRLLKSGTVLTPMAVGMGRASKVLGGKVFQFNYGQNKRNRPLLANSRFRSKEEPYWLDTQGTQALAVLPAGSTVPVLMDSELKRLDLTEAERQGLFAPVGA